MGTKGMACADVHDANNHMKGTEFAVEPCGADSPIRRGVVTVDGVRMRIAVFPEKVGRSGRVYFPVRLQYAEGSGFVLKAVRAGNAEVRA